MARKWLEISPWHNEPQGAVKEPAAKPTGPESQLSSAHQKSSAKFLDLDDESAAGFQAELLSMEDIYRAAGIMNPRRGYSINKVVEMLRSPHIVGLSKEMKRAAMLMALEAAGVSIDQVRQDAKARQEALDSYATLQKKQVEAEWARRAEENIQIEADLVRVKAHYMARISRNLEGVAREKSTFENWLATKKQETENMSEAVELCVDLTAPGSATASLANAAAAGSPDKTV